MTTKQILLSALIFSAIGTNIVANDKQVFTKGLENTIHGESLALSILGGGFSSKLDHIEIMEKLGENFFARGTIGELKRTHYVWERLGILRSVASNDGVKCDDIIILNTTNTNDCNNYQVLTKHLLNSIRNKLPSLK